MAKVTGIGGVFLRSADPKALTAWYAEHLGVAIDAWGGGSFAWREDPRAATGQTAWRVFERDTTYFGDSGQSVLVDYRVDDLDGLLEKLAAAGVWIDPHRQDESYGRFAWIRDPDGNRVELWQPLD